MFNKETRDLLVKEALQCGINSAGYLDYSIYDYKRVAIIISNVSSIVDLDYASKGVLGKWYGIALLKLNHELAREGGLKVELDKLFLNEAIIEDQGTEVAWLYKKALEEGTHLSLDEAYRKYFYERTLL